MSAPIFFTEFGKDDWRKGSDPEFVHISSIFRRQEDRPTYSNHATENTRVRSSSDHREAMAAADSTNPIKQRPAEPEAAAPLFCGLGAAAPPGLAPAGGAEEGEPGGAAGAADGDPEGAAGESFWMLMSTFWAASQWPGMPQRKYWWPELLRTMESLPVV